VRLCNPECFQETSVSEMTSFNTEAMKCTALGVTIMVSSGDNGVMNFGCTCKSSEATSMDNCACDASSSSSVSDWTGSNSWSGDGYFPSFPASCPYVTALGATMGAGSSAVPSVGTGEKVCMVCDFRLD
jgi:subtilase family serine protease